MKSTRVNKAMMFDTLGKILMTVMIMTLMLLNFCRSLTILKILNALRIVTAVAKLLSSPIKLKTRPISAETTMNISKRFHPESKYRFLRANSFKNISRLNTIEK